MEIIIHVFKHALMISVFVFIMMVFIDYINIMTQGKVVKYMKKGRMRQYLVSSFLGATPGCLGAFMSVSLYVHGLISFGAIVGCMIATSGDEAFVMLAMFPFKALFLFMLLFVLGIFSAYFADKLIRVFRIKVCTSCEVSGERRPPECRILSLPQAFKDIKNISLEKFLLLLFIFVFLYSLLAKRIGPEQWGWEKLTFLGLLILGFFMVFTAPQHYLQTHIWSHVFKKHFFKVFAWTFFALLVVDYGLKFWDLETFVRSHMLWILLIAVLIGIIPESGPHMIFVMMFAKGLIPFSVILASSIVQDGHGMLPLFSHSVKDSLWVKLFNVVIGLSLGTFLYLVGL